VLAGLFIFFRLGMAKVLRTSVWFCGGNTPPRLMAVETELWRCGCR